VRLFLIAFLFCIGFNSCYGMEEDLGLSNSPNVPTSLAIINLDVSHQRSIPRYLLDPHFFRRPKVSGIPSIDDFFRKGFLVRVCNLYPVSDWDALIPVSYDRPCSYWTLNSIVPADYSDNFNNSNAFIISPLAKRWQNVISISFPEVMVAGELTLGEGDILLLNQQSIGSICNEPKFRKNCASKGITVTVYKGKERPSYTHTRDIKTDLKVLEEPRRIVNTLIEEMGGWVVEMPLGFWTPTTAVKIDGSIVHPFHFFDKFLEGTPVSFGTDFYSSHGLAHLLSLTNRTLSFDPKRTLYPRYFKALKQCLKEGLEEYFGQFKYFNESARTAIRKFLDMKPEPYAMATKYQTSKEIEKATYREEGFIIEITEPVMQLSSAIYDKLKSKMSGISTEQFCIFDTIFRFSKWAQSLSPVLVFADQLPSSIVLPSEIDLSILRRLPLSAKTDIFRYVFQRYHNKGVVDMGLVLKMFDDPVAFFEKLYRHPGDYFK